METQWPKTVPVLTPEQQRIREEFMSLWHEVLPQKYGMIERFNHGYPVRRRREKKERIRTLELGPGFGAHMHFEDLATQDYYGMELRAEMAKEITKKFPNTEVVIGDCQEKIPFPDAFFDRIVAIHVLEHLPNLPKALQEMNRVLKKSGQLTVVIPCEGGHMYTLGRRVSAQRIFTKRYNQSYDWFVKSEHVSQAFEIVAELKKIFRVEHREYFPFRIPSKNANLCIGLDCTKV